MTPDDSSATPSPQPTKTRSRSRIIKWLVRLTVVLTSFLVVIGLLLTYWFPSNLVREELESRLSELLQGMVTIQSLEFNTLTGLQIRALDFRKPDQPPLTFDRLTLDYSLLGLLTGTFTINEVTIERANISLNLPELTQGPPSEKPVSPSPTEPTSLPPFPISIELDTLAIIDSQVQAIVSPDLQVALSNINLESSGTVSPEEAHLKGQLSIDQLAVDFKNKHVQLPLDIKFSTQINLATQHLNLEELTIASHPSMRMTLSGTVSNFFTQDDIQLSLTNTQFQLESLLKTAQAFVPPKWNTAKIKGSLSPTFSLHGALPDGQFLGTVQAGLQADKLQVSLPSLALDLGSTSLDIRAKDIRIKNNQPTGGQLSTKTEIQDLTFQAYQLQNLELALAGDGLIAGPFSGTLNFKGKTKVPPEIIGTSFTLPFDLTLDTTGNHHTREVQLKNLAMDLGNFGSLQAKAAITPHTSPNPDMEVSLDLRIRPRLQALLSLLPPDQLQGLALDASPNPESMIFRITGLLQNDFQPRLATATAALKLSSIGTTWDKMGVGGNLDQLTLLLSSKYQQQEGAFHGTLGFSTKLSDLRATEQLNLETMGLILKSSFKGNLSPTFQPLKLHSQEQLQVTLHNIKYDDQSVTATLPSLKLALQTKEDLTKQDFILEQFRVMSEDILDLNMQGQFSQATQQFTINLESPLIHIGNLLRHLSGPVMEGMEGINPKGRLELTMQASGRLPESTDLEKLTLPLGLKSSLALHNLSGAVAGYHVQGGTGTLDFGYAPNASPQTQLNTAFHIDRIELPDTLPLHELRDTAIRLNMTSPDLNEVHLDPIHLTSQGIDFSTKTVLVGIRDFLFSSTTPLGAKLAKLFVKLDTQLRLDLEPLQQVLETYGVSGSGKTQVDIHLLKREQGDLKASIRAGGKNVSVNQDGMELKNMNGGLQIRKILRWNPDKVKAASQKHFLPSDRIAQLKSLSGKGQRISIDAFTLGPLAIQRFSSHVAFQEHILRIQNLAMNLLGGGIGGNIALAIEHPLRLSADFEIADLDLNELMRKNNRIKGDSKIAATLALDARFQDETGAVDLSRLTCQVNITHIGKEALNRLLVFLDPEGSNPTLSNARAQLKLANPSHVSIDIARGQLNLVIDFQGSLIPKFKLDRIPIAKMKQIEKLTAAIPDWETLVPLLDMVGAETYAFSPEGELVLH